MQIEDISPTLTMFTPSFPPEDQSRSGKALCVAISPDGQRVYVGGYSGVWRSDDGGATWWHPEWRPAAAGGPTATGALLPPNVYDLIVHATDRDVVFAAAGKDARYPALDGVYRSVDGAQTWTLVHRVAFPLNADQTGFLGCLSAAPDDPGLLYAAGRWAVARTTDGGQAWTEFTPSNGREVNHVVVGPAGANGRRVYASGDEFWVSSDGGSSWEIDPGGPRIGQVGEGGRLSSPSARSLAIHPHNDHVLYVVKSDLTLWKGEYADADAVGVWTQLPSPPVAGGTDSGCTFVMAHAIPSGEVLLFVSDRRSVHVTSADPVSSASYALVDRGQHADPHGLAMTPDFRPWAPDVSPSGHAVLINDGGANLSTDGMQTWQPGQGLSTLNVINIGVNTLPGGSTTITFGGGDNCGFSSADGGVSWKTQDYLGGDNDCAFADPRQPTRMLLFAPRSGYPVKGELYLFASQGGDPPDTAYGSAHRQRIPGPITTCDDGTACQAWNAVSWYYIYGYRPLVLTRSGETPRPDGDFVTIRWMGVPERSPCVLLRTTSLSSITQPSDWDTESSAEQPGVKVFQIGPELPMPGIGVVQSAGGHEGPTFYVSDVNKSGRGLWKLAPGMADWLQIVPSRVAGGGPSATERFFVDPYRPERLYVLAGDHVYRSDDGGQSWVQDVGLDRAITEGGSFPRLSNPRTTVLSDMQFDPTEPNYRLALGIAGVFLTQDGVTWSPLLRSSAVALQPTSMTYDPVACERTLYVATLGRGLLRLRPLPPDWTLPVGRLQSARGRITLLRVHDLGTGYGPAYDHLDAEVVVSLDTQPGKAFGLKLRRGSDRPAADGKLAVLRDCFTSDRPVLIDFVRMSCRTGEIVRVIEGI